MKRQRATQYKVFLHEDQGIPRSTLYKRRRRLEAERLMFLKQRAARQESTAANREPDSPLVLSDPANHESIFNCENQVDDPHNNQVNEQETLEDTEFASSINGDRDGSDLSDCSEETFSQVNNILNENSAASFDAFRFSGTRMSNEYTSDMTGPKLTENVESKAESTLCPCSSLKDTDVILMCLALGMRHGLTWEAQLDIFRLINAIYGSQKIAPTKYQYFRHLNDDPQGIHYHIFCPDCQKYLGKRIGNKGCVLCPNCNSDIKVSSVANFFLSAPIEDQLQKMLAFPNVANMLFNYRFKRQKNNDHALEDICDGDEYKRHFINGGILSKPENFSYTFFTDGVAMGKSSNKTMWPIYLTLNELPPLERRKHVILAGLYVGPNDPDHRVFLLPFVENANKLSTEGLTWNYQGESITSKIIPLVAILDSVARYQVMNHQSFHAIQGCTYCYTKQSRTKKGRRYTLDASKALRLRTNSSRLDDLRMLHEKSKNGTDNDLAHKGVKGVSALMTLKYFNFSAGFVVDYMHSVLIGTTKTYTELILESCRKSSFWVGMDEVDIGMDHVITTIDQRLAMIKPPTSISRVPRPLSDRKLWRANEWRTWLLYYSIPCLSGLLMEKHLLHLSMLSKGVHLLLRKSVSREDVYEAHRLFQCFAYYYQDYLKEEEMLYNLHLLLHTAKCVLDWGPLWANSSFMYESQNKYLLEMRKSPCQVAVQIVRKYLLFFSFPTLCEKLCTKEETLEYCEDILNRKLKVIVRCGNNMLLGVGKPWIPSIEEENCLYDFCKFRKESCLAYQKLVHKRKRFATTQYHANKKTDNSVIYLTNGKIAIIRHILLIPNLKVVLLVQEVVVHSESILANDIVQLQHLKLLCGTGALFCIYPHSIDDHGIQMNLQSKVFFSPFIFGCNGD